MMVFQDLLRAYVSDVNVSTILVFAVVLASTYLLTRKPPEIPPGYAITFPIVGDLPYLIGGDILNTLWKLRQRHGDILSVYFGNDLTIIINGFELIQKAAVKQGQIFSGRPKDLISNILGEDKGIAFTEGPFWKRQRKFIHSSLQEFGFGKTTLEDNIMREVTCFADILRQQKGEPFDFKNSIQASVANVVFAIVCGKRHDYNDESYVKFLRAADITAQKIIENSVLVKCVPFLRYIPGDPLQMNEITRFLGEWDEFIMKMFEDHKETHDENNPRNLMDFYITEILKGNSSKENTDFTLEQLITVTRDLFGAGSETTTTAIRWAVLFLLKHPDVQKRLHAEITRVVPDNRSPTLEDRTELPYVEAFIQEVLRYANVIPLSVPHRVTAERDAVFEGYRIPKNTTIMFNLDSVLMDPNIFENPREFNPDRFLDSKGNIIRPKELIPFGIGRRVCLGEALAKMELFLFITTLIQNFHFVSSDISEPDMKGIVGLTNSPKPYRVRAIDRLGTD